MDLPEAMGTILRPLLAARRLDKYWRRPRSLDCIWRTESCHESGVLGRKGEQGLFTWMSWRVEPCSDAWQLGVLRASARERKTVQASVKKRVAILSEVVERDDWVDIFIDIYTTTHLCVFTIHHFSLT